MRGLSKPWPPPNVSPAGQAGRTFVQAEIDYTAALPGAADRTAFARTAFDQLEKRSLRAVMYREQRSLCAYCERSIAEGDPVPRIDHWRPLSLNHDVALHWSNLYLTCATSDTCDAAKADRPFRWADADPDLPWPTAFQYERVIGFTSRGEIYIRNDVNLEESRLRALQLAIDDQVDGARRRAAILNLNHPALVAARAASIDSERTRLERDFRDQTATRAQRQGLAAAMLAMNPLPQFVSIRVLWLRKQMGRGR